MGSYGTLAKATISIKGLVKDKTRRHYWVTLEVTQLQFLPQHKTFTFLDSCKIQVTRSKLKFTYETKIHLLIE